MGNGVGGLLTRRRFAEMTVPLALACVGSRPNLAWAQDGGPRFSYPMGLPGRAMGDGFYVRIAYAAENAPYYPGWWHTGENWHRTGDQTAGLGVYAVAAGEVVFAGSDYPGLVVIVQHDAALYSMYGHLDDALTVEAGQRIERGQLLGTVLARSDDLARSHLHFELRTFLTKDEINGSAPQYGVSCGYECPPGPGYWPMSAPEHPSDLGWRNPIHLINRRAWPGGIPGGTEVVVAESAPDRAPLWTALGQTNGRELAGELPLTSGDRYPLLAIATGAEDGTETSAEATRLWYQIEGPDGTAAWVQAATPSPIDRGADGRPSSLAFNLLAAVDAP